MAFYVLDENKNLVLSFDAEGFLAILQQAIADQSLANIDPDSAVASKLRSVINGTTHHIEFITAAEYSDLENRGLLVAGTYYFITDDTTEEDLEEAIGGLISRVGSLEQTVGSLDTTLTFGEPSAEFSVVTIKENGTTTKKEPVPRGLYIARVYDQRDTSSPKIASTLIVYYDGVSYCRSPIFDFLVFGVGSTMVEMSFSPNGVIVGVLDADVPYYKIELRQIGKN